MAYSDYIIAKYRVEPADFITIMAVRRDYWDEHRDLDVNFNGAEIERCLGRDGPYQTSVEGMLYFECSYDQAFDRMLRLGFTQDVEFNAFVNHYGNEPCSDFIIGITDNGDEDVTMSICDYRFWNTHHYINDNVDFSPIMNILREYDLFESGDGEFELDNNLSLQTVMGQMLTRGFRMSNEFTDFINQRAEEDGEMDNDDDDNDIVDGYGGFYSVPEHLSPFETFDPNFKYPIPDPFEVDDF